MSLLLLLLSLLAPAPASAIELSLEENKAERGTIGYVDMQRVFRLYPGTARAKENFEELVRQAEEQVSLRKAEVLKLRREVSELKAERELLARTPIVVEPSPTPLPGFSAGSSTAAAPSLSTAAVPGVSTAAAASPPLIPGASTAPAAALPPAGEPAPAPPAAAPTQALAGLDARLADKQEALDRREAEFKAFEAAAEKNLLEIESRKTEILLGRIHSAVREVARREGVGVIVDKGSILYGHDAVDLTEKVLKRLKGS